MGVDYVNYLNSLFCSYYEWRTSLDGKKQPYFIYFPQDTGSSSNGLYLNKNQEIKVEPNDADVKDCKATDSKG